MRGSLFTEKSVTIHVGYAYICSYVFLKKKISEHVWIADFAPD